MLFICLSAGAYSQTAKEPIRFEKRRFWQGEKILSPRQVLDVMKDNQPAHAEFKKAMSNNGAAQVFGFIGGALIGWPIGTAIAGGEAEWGLAAAGAGVLLLSIPFSSGFNKHARQAITIYNSGTGTANARPYSIHFVPYATGAKFVVRF